ncbi:MAG TPA: hypothetical protein VMV77_03335 [Bacteroidales bacterium]|nr:hypothetical protein [Bacteroidales bacterium]
MKTISVAAHPGVSITELVRHYPKWLMFVSSPLFPLFSHSQEKGALPVLYAAPRTDVRGGDYFGPQGRSEMTGKPGKAESTALSHNEDIAKQLWEVSEKLKNAMMILKNGQQNIS